MGVQASARWVNLDLSQQNDVDGPGGISVGLRIKHGPDAEARDIVWVAVDSDAEDEREEIWVPGPQAFAVGLAFMQAAGQRREIIQEYGLGLVEQWSSDAEGQAEQ